MVDINWTLLAQIVNFLILLLLVSRFAYKPIVKIMNERQQKIADSLENAEKLKIEAQKIRAEYDQQLAQARAEAQIIIDKANKAAQDAYDRMLAQAREEQERIFKTGQEQIEREKINALLAVRGEVISLSLQLAGRIIEKQLDEETDKKLINDFLSELADKSGGLPC